MSYFDMRRSGLTGLPVCSVVLALATPSSLVNLVFKFTAIPPLYRL